MLNLQFAETMELQKLSWRRFMEEILCILAISQAVHGEGSGHLGQSLISGRKILTMILPLLIVVVDI